MDNRTFGYARVSSKEQHEDRQIEALINYGVAKGNIIIDKCSGKDTEREGYQYIKNRFFAMVTLWLLKNWTDSAGINLI